MRDEVRVQYSADPKVMERYFTADKFDPAGYLMTLRAQAQKAGVPANARPEPDFYLWVAATIGGWLEKQGIDKTDAQAEQLAHLLVADMFKGHQDPIHSVN